VCSFTSAIAFCLTLCAFFLFFFYAVRASDHCHFILCILSPSLKGK
jgi:hypothetical protein